MNYELFTEEGLNLLLNATKEEEVKKGVRQALENFAMADEVSRQTKHYFANREGKLGDLLTEMQIYLKDEERKAVLNSAYNIVSNIGWIFKGAWILGESAVIGTGKGIGAIGKKLKPAISKASGSVELESLKLQIELEKLKLEKIKLTQGVRQEEDKL